MDRSWYYRVGFYALITLMAAFVLTPTVATWMGKDEQLPAWMKKNLQKKILLGLDLQGGLHLVYYVEVDKAVSDKADRLAADLEEKLRKDKKVKDVRIEREGTTVLVARFTNPAELAKLDHALLKEYGRYLFEESRDTAKGEARLKVEDAYIDELKHYAIDQGVKTIRGRVDKLGVAEPTVSKKGTDIVVELPGLRPEDFERVKNLIGRTAQLEFKMGDDGSEYMKKLADIVAAKKAEFPGITISTTAGTRRRPARSTPTSTCAPRTRRDREVLRLARPRGAVPSDHEIGFEEVNSRDEEGNVGQKADMWRTHYLHRRAELTGEYLTDAEVTCDPQTGRPEVSRAPSTARAPALFEKASGANIGRKMAIILDERINSAPVIESRIGGGRARITWAASADPVQAPAGGEGSRRRAAAPARSRPRSRRPSRPRSARRSAATPSRRPSSRWRSARSPSSSSCSSTTGRRGSSRTSRCCSTSSISSPSWRCFGATLTLPGIAGVVLTVGMAVDANIIIYERIREELRAGKSPRGAVEAGFGRAFSTVFDAHVTDARRRHRAVLLRHRPHPRLRGHAHDRRGGEPVHVGVAVAVDVRLHGRPQGPIFPVDLAVAGERHGRTTQILRAHQARPRLRLRRAHAPAPRHLRGAGARLHRHAARSTTSAAGTC